MDRKLKAVVLLLLCLLYGVLFSEFQREPPSGETDRRGPLDGAALPRQRTSAGRPTYTADGNMITASHDDGNHDTGEVAATATATATATRRGPSEHKKKALAAVDCAGWGCSCQGMSDTFGTSPGRWHMARRESKPAMLWWHGHGCSTSPEAPVAGLPALPALPAPAAPLPPPAEPRVVTVTISAAAAAAAAVIGCARWNCTCQGMSDTFGTSYGRWHMAARETAAIRFWTDRGCRTAPGAGVEVEPRTAPPGSVTVLAALRAPPPASNAAGKVCVDLGGWKWAATPGGAAVPLLSEVYDGTQFVGNCGVPPQYTMKPNWKLAGKRGDWQGPEFCEENFAAHAGYNLVRAADGRPLADAASWDTAAMLDGTLRGKTVVFVGDSMSAQQAFALRCQLAAVLSTAGTDFEIDAPDYAGWPGNPHRGGAFRMLVPRYNFSLVNMRRDTLDQNNQNGTGALNPEIAATLARIAPDVAVFHTGPHIWDAHYRPSTPARVRRWFALFSGLGDLMRRGLPGTTFVVRFSGIPKHFRCAETARPDQRPDGPRSYSAFDSRTQHANCWVHWLQAKLARRALRGAADIVFDPWQIDFHRADAHRGGASSDCLHYCLPSVPLFWNVMLFGQLLAANVSTCDDLHALADVCAGPGNVWPIEAYIDSDTIAAFNTVMAPP